MELSHQLELLPSITQRWWRILTNYFEEESRHYHTFQHISELVELTEIHRHMIQNIPAVMLAIFFHDIVYNPKSSFNEDDSNDIFLQFVVECNSCNVSKHSNLVFSMIDMTKRHVMSDDEYNFDMKFFRDIDMAILGSDKVRYAEYAAQVRQEYMFVDFKTYCLKRSEFLESCLSSTSPLFCTELFLFEKGKRALSNIRWECDMLRRYQCPVKFYQSAYKCRSSALTMESSWWQRSQRIRLTICVIAFGVAHALLNDHRMFDSA